MITGYFASYGKKKGELRALKEDFEEVLRQTKRTFQATEALRDQIATRSAIGQELREAVRQLTTSIAAALHSMCWVAWSKAYGALSEDQIKSYDSEIHQLSPQIIGQLAMIAAIDEKTYRELTDTPTLIFDLDVEIGKAIVRIRKADIAVAEWQDIHSRVVKHIKNLSIRIADTIGKKYGSETTI